MALVESSCFMSWSEERLMAGPRIQLPRLPIQSTPQPTFASALALPPNQRSLERRLSLEDPILRPRKNFAFSAGTSSDMETYHGHVRTPQDAIILFEACRIGLLPRVQRRLSEKERQSIKSGSVFVWDEREAGMRRWTDGKSWSASRVSGSFLTYREMEGKRGGGGSGYPPPVAVLSRAGRTPDSTHGSESEIDAAGDEGPDGYRYKPDGLVKQSFSITTSSGNHLHLISYYSRAHPASQQLNTPSGDAQLRHIRPAKGMYPESTVHEHQNIPAVTRSPMAGAPYTTTPQMAGYARQGPPQWPQQQYGWPLGTASQQPQYQYYGYPYGSGPAPGPSPSNNHSPASYGHPSHYSPSQPPDRNHPRYEQRPPAPHQEYRTYDSRRYPPTPPESRTNTQQNHMHSPDVRPRPSPSPYQQPNSYATAPRAYSQGPLDPNRYQSSPQVREQPASASHPHTLQTNGMQQPPASQQGWTPGPLPPPQSTRTPPVHYQHSQTKNPPSTPIDPQLTGRSSTSHLRGGQSNERPAASASANPRNEPAHNPASQSNGYPPTATSMIPSIGALVDSSAAPSQRASNSIATPTNGVGNGYSYYPPSSEQKSTSENAKGKDGPQDILNGNVAFGEDKRTINILDRGFKV